MGVRNDSAAEKAEAAGIDLTGGVVAEKSGGLGQRGDLDDDVRPRAIQEFFNRSAARAVLRFNGQTALIERGAVPQCVYSHNAKRENLALCFQKARERTPYISITDQSEFQKSIFSIRVLSSDSSAVFLRFRLLC